MKTILLTVILSILYMNISFANTINVPADVDSIQGGINRAVNGDTVLVQPGTYLENINFNGKNIVVGSLTLTTGDTSYISNTIIDGNHNGSVIKFENGEDSTTVLCGFTLTNGRTLYSADDRGGGILLRNSNPTISYLCIKSNKATAGGGMYLEYSNPKISQVTLRSNQGYKPLTPPIPYPFGGFGGGIYCVYSNPVMKDIIIIDNFSSWGGGIYCVESNPTLINTIISNNDAYYGSGDLVGLGGGIHLKYSSAILNNVMINANISGFSGGGIYCYESNIEMSNVTIKENSGGNHGGGIVIEGNSNLIFDPIDRCNIFLNRSKEGRDLNGEYGALLSPVVLDTFTVLIPNNYFAFPISNFTFDILNAKIEQSNSDLYVSPNGSNANSGLSPMEPLKTIEFALMKILADSLNPHTIYLANGVYGPSTTGEQYPLLMRDYVSLSGESESTTILDADSGGNIMTFWDIQGVTIKNLTMTRGSAGGIVLGSSNPHISNVTITKCFGRTHGGGIWCVNSTPTLSYVTISNNTTHGISYGGGIWCEYSNPIFTNVTISNNVGKKGGGIFCWDSNPILVNTILWNNSSDAVTVLENSIVSAFFSDIQDTLWPGVGNINADPMFVDTTNGDYRLQVGSPCIDAGIQDTIIIYNNGLDTLIVPPMLYIGSAPDMGAYEFDPSSYINQVVNSPKKYSFEQNYPNPFNPTTIIKYKIPKSEKVKIEVFNLLGQKIETLINKHMPTGSHEVEFTAKNLPSGIYMYRIEARKFQQVKKMILLK
jgi:hypothetical protein